MIFSENRYPLFGIMRYGAGNSSAVRPVSRYVNNPTHSRAAVSVRRNPSPTLENGRSRSIAPRVR
jgi:hypothetical protein